MVKSRHQRVGEDFDRMVKELQRELSQMHGRQPTYKEITNSMTNFLKEERIDERMLQRARNRYQRGLF